MNSVVLKVLIVVTSHSQLGNTGKPTGYYLPEVTHPYFALEAAGYQVDIASPRGGKAPMDESSRDLSDPANRAFLERADLVQKIENTIPLSSIRSKDYQAILFAGGHGTMWDFPNNREVNRIASDIYTNGGVVAAVCHGPAALLGIRLPSGKYLINGKSVTGFTNAEEAAIALTDVMPFLLESELIKRGARFSGAPLWQENVIVSERLVTGQNPASAKKVGEAVAELLNSLR